MTTPQSPVSDNELELRRRILAATEDLSDLMKDMGDRVRELHDLNVPASEWLDLVARHAPDAVRVLYDRYGGFITSLIDGWLDSRKANAKTGTEGIAAAVVGMIQRDAARPRAYINDVVRVDDTVDNPDWLSEGQRMRMVITRLFDGAPKLTDAKGAPDPSQAPALECQLMLKAGGVLVGSLSTTPEGGLRMLCPNELGPKRTPVMVEHHFDYEQVADIALIREIKGSGIEVKGSSIITS